MTDPHGVFRWLRRDQRAEYVRKMHDTMAVQYRDFQRAVDRLWRAVIR